MELLENEQHEKWLRGGCTRGRQAKYQTSLVQSVVEILIRQRRDDAALPTPEHPLPPRLRRTDAIPKPSTKRRRVRRNSAVPVELFPGIYVPDVSKDDTQWQQTDKTALQQTGTEGFQRAGAIARRGVTPATF